MILVVYLGPWHVSFPVAVSYFIKNISKDVSREFDEFQVNTHHCKLRCWYL